MAQLKNLYAIPLSLKSRSRAVKKDANDAGARGMPVLLDFSAYSSYDGDFDISDVSHNVTGISGIQAVYIDNRNNASPAIFTFASTSQFTIIAPAYSQGFYPILFDGLRLKFNATCTGGALCIATFLNVDVAYNVWNANTPLAGSVSVSGNVTTQGVQGAFINRSGTIAVANTSQVLCAANSLRKRFIIKNPSTAAGQGIAATESLFINFTTTAVTGPPSFELLPGESFDTGAGPITTEAINVIAATVSHAFVAKEM